MANVRVGVIGLGNIGQLYARTLAAGKITGAELAAIATSVPSKAEAYKAAKLFPDGEALIHSQAVDAVVIATPHFQHTELGIAALQAGLHVMVEKPISAHKADAQRLIDAHQKNPRLVFGAMFQLRTEPRYLKIRALLQDGELGQVVRMSWIVTDWFRTEAYYQSNPWRATWKGEGGGVLLNQCLHNLDLLQWLLGMPAKVRGFCQLGRFHEIEVEDNITAWFEYPNGATGIFVSSTGEAPGANRFELAGSRGKLVLESEKLSFTRNEVDMFEFSRTSAMGFSKPEAKSAEIPFDNAADSHAVVMQNFINAIRDGEPLLVPGEEGIHSVELANAILYSSLTGQTVELPLDSAAYARKLDQLIAESKVEKKTSPKPGSSTPEDFTRSFKR